jgi:dipeptidyl aminopeptidase/acylaminoacyl peptidase
MPLTPINYITADDPPILFLHGDQDDTVPIKQSKDRYEKMQAQGIQAELLIILSLFLFTNNIEHK